MKAAAGAGAAGPAPRITAAANAAKPVAARATHRSGRASTSTTIPPTYPYGTKRHRPSDGDFVTRHERRAVRVRPRPAQARHSGVRPPRRSARPAPARRARRARSSRPNSRAASTSDAPKCGRQVAPAEQIERPRLDRARRRWDHPPARRRRCRPRPAPHRRCRRGSRRPPRTCAATAPSQPCRRNLVEQGVRVATADDQQVVRRQLRRRRPPSVDHICTSYAPWPARPSRSQRNPPACAVTGIANGQYRTVRRPASAAAHTARSSSAVPPPPRWSRISNPRRSGRRGGRRRTPPVAP